MPAGEKGTKIVRVCMLGSFSLTVDGNSISDQGNHMHKLWNLLAYLIYHRNRRVTQSEFIECFWGEQAKESAVNALKTQLFRIRQLLIPLFGESTRPILSFRGGYQWNPHLDTRVDLDEFEEIVHRLHRHESSEAKRSKLFQEAVSLYQGSFLNKLSHLPWVEEEATRCRTLYLDLMREYVKFLEKHTAYDDLVQHLRRAAEIHPLEESLHAGIVRGLLRQENYVDALSHYEQATDLLYRNLGLQPWKELRELYNLIMATEQLYEADLTVIQQDLSETMKKEGAFFCEYGSFREIYRLEVRRAARSGTETHIVLLTILNQDSTIPEAKVVERAMEQLKEAILKSLRSGDVFTRYSSTQYLIMLAVTTPEQAEAIANRIFSRLWRYREPRLKVSTRIRKMVLL